MQKYYLLGALFFTMFIGQGYPAMDAGVIAPKGEVILFYKADHKIVVKQCENYTVLKLRSDCKVLPGTVVQNVSVSDFKHSLKMALKLSGGNYDAQTKWKIRFFNNREDGSVNTLFKKQRELKSQVSKIEAFIKEFGVQNVDIGNFLSLKEALFQVNDELAGHSQLGRIVQEINGKIDDLVDRVISSETFYRYIFSKDETGFVFNILRALTRSPFLSASFQKISRGSFLMGSPPSEYGRRTDEDQKRVTISKSFDIMRTEVTQMQWFLVMGVNHSRFKGPKDCDGHIRIDGVGLCPHNPVERVSWNEVQSYIKRLNDALNLPGCRRTPKDSKGCYRLPTEAEWEFAVRGGAKTDYSFGNTSGLLKDYAWYKENSGGSTHPVGLKNPNPYGLHDVHGNVWEWVQDHYGKVLPGGRNPLHTSSGSDRVVRGGAWSSVVLNYLRSASRYYLNQEARHYSLGFRLVRTR